MPRKVTSTETEGPYHVSCRCINREWFSLPMDNVWAIFTDYLYFINHAFGVEIHAFVLMSNHYHLLVSTPLLNLSEAMAYFHREMSRQLNRYGNRINRTFAGRYFKSLLVEDIYFTNCYKYIYQNPVRAGIVKRVEEYKYSTLQGKLGVSYLGIPVTEDSVLFAGDVGANLEWLNCAANEQDLESMRGALARGVFRLRKDLSSKRPNRLESKLL